jgi:hypothetical protein
MFKSKNGFEIPKSLERIEVEVNYDKTDDQWILMARDSNIKDLITLIFYLRNRGMPNTAVKRTYRQLRYYLEK